MKNNDDMLSKQGEVYILVDQDGYLVREDVESGTRFRYPISDDDTKYKAGEGLILSGDTFSVDKTMIPSTSDVNTMINGSISGLQTDVSFLKTNKHYIKHATEASDYTFELEYDPNYDIFIDSVIPSSNIVEIEPIAFNEHTLENRNVATFESWITCNGQVDIETLSIDEDITVVGEIPETLSGTLTHVFVRRIFKDQNGDIHEAISFAYSF